MELLQPVATAAIRASRAADGPTSSLLSSNPGAASMSIEAVAAARRRAEAAAAESRLQTVSGKVLSLLLDYTTARRMSVLRVLNSFDVDRSGELDDKNLLDATSKLGIVISQEDMQQLMRELDGDGGGTVSTAEFWQAIRQTKKDRYTLAARDAREAHTNRGADANSEFRGSRSAWTESPRRRNELHNGRSIDGQLLRTVHGDAPSEALSGPSSSNVWVISCAKAAQQRRWISAIGSTLVGTKQQIGPGGSLLEVSLQEGEKQVAGDVEMLVHTPEVRLQVALRRAQLRDKELLQSAVHGQLDVSSDSELESEEEAGFRYMGPDGPHIDRIRQHLRAASFGGRDSWPKGEIHGHGQQVKTLFERFETNGLLSRADFGCMLRLGGKASSHRTHGDARMTSLRVSDDRPGHAGPLRLSEDEVDAIFRALDPNEAGGVDMDKLRAFIWGTSMS